MKKSILHKPVRNQAMERSKDDANISGFNLKDIITIFGGVTGLIVAILWLAGRAYTAGYYSAMNIPAFQINLSVWEYAEASWQRLIYYFGEKLYTPMVLVASVMLVVLLASSVTQRFFPRIRVFDAVKNFYQQVRILLGTYRFVMGLSIATYLFYLLLLALVDINEVGKAIGKEKVLRNSHLIDVYSTNSLPLEQGEILQDTSPALIHYSNLHLLTFNNGKYYLFRDLDINTCKPQKVFVIEDSQTTHFVIGNIPDLGNLCENSPQP